MEDDVEVDVLGDFNLENLLTKNESRISCFEGENQLGLNCEYSSASSQWLLDSASQSCWYDNKSEDHGHCSCTPSTLIEPSSSNDVCGWSDKEKYLLEKGLELFGRSWARLAQYIGSKTAQQVKSYVRSMGIEYNLLSEPPNVSSLGFGVDNSEFNFSELINDMEIPASIEEVIEVVSTAQPTVQTAKTTSRQRYSSGSSDTIRHANKLAHKGSKKKLHKYKIKQREKKSKQMALLCRVTTKKLKETNVSPLQLLNSNKEGKDVIVLPSGEEIIRIQRESVDSTAAESDIEVDVDSDHAESEIINKTNNELPNPQFTQVFKGDMLTPSGKVMTVIVDKPAAGCWLEETSEEKPAISTLGTKYNSIIQDRLNAIYCLPPPTQELKIHPDEILEEEERLHPEFFGGSYSKRKRYMKIRNHIIDCWKNSKPKYVTKTAIRTGLKNCGDIRLISRIHAYLEHRGYINFGCEQCYYKNVTSQVNLKSDDMAKNPICNSLVFDETISSQTASSRGERRKIRKKKVYLESSSEDSEDGEYTMAHMDSGEIVVQHLPKNFETKPEKVKKRQRKMSMSINLIDCKQFTKENCAPFSVEMEISALLLVNIHSLASPKCEVIGLLGGTYDYEQQILSISSAVPCKTTLSNNVHCDMCPVSEYEGSQKLAEEELSVVGWYHSHPDFAPNPSDTDLETQNSMQAFFNKTSQPFIGFILTPSYKSTSDFRCIVVRKLDNDFIPFHLNVKLCCSNFDLTWLKSSLDAALATLGASCLGNVSQEVFINKCVTSARHNLKAVTPKLEKEKVEELASKIENMIISLFEKNNCV